MWRELGAVCTGMGWKCGDTLRQVWVPYLDCAVPRTGKKCVFGDQIPMDRKNLSCVLRPRLYRKLIKGDVEELDASVTRARE